MRSAVLISEVLRWVILYFLERSNWAVWEGPVCSPHGSLTGQVRLSLQIMHPFSEGPGGPGSPRACGWMFPFISPYWSLQSPARQNFDPLRCPSCSAWAWTVQVRLHGFLQNRCWEITHISQDTLLNEFKVLDLVLVPLKFMFNFSESLWMACSP